MGRLEMDILLINPRNVRASTFPSGEFFDCTAPNMGLAYIAAALEERGHDVEILDANALGLDDAQLTDRLANRDPQIIGTTATTSTFPDALGAIGIAGELHPGAFTIMGGIHVSYVPMQTLRECPQIDVVCIGEGERTIVELVEVLEDGTDRLDAVRGIAFRRGDQIIQTDPRPCISDLDSLPLPARHLLPLESYASGGHPSRTASIVSSRGCPFACGFCATPFIAGKRYRARSARNILHEIEQIVNVHGLNSFEFVDDLFTLDKGRVEAICRGIVERGLSVSWTCSARADTINPALLSSMAEAGCECIFFGIESGSQRILDDMGKRETLAQMSDAVRVTRQAGIGTWGFFIIGFPDETAEEIETTIRFAREIELDFAEFFIASAYPGSPLCEYAKEHDLIMMDDWADISYGNPNIRNANVSPEDMKGYLVKAYRDFYTSPEVMSRLSETGNTAFLDEILRQVEQAG